LRVIREAAFEATTTSSSAGLAEVFGAKVIAPPLQFELAAKGEGT